MGYKLTSLVNLPLDDRTNMYVFSIGDDMWEGGLANIVHRNFDRIAKEIGPQAIIVGALEASFHDEVVSRYLGKNAKEMKNLLPALLITDSHPDKLTSDSLRLLIPMEKVYDRYKVIDRFLSELAAFVRGESDALLKHIEGSPGIAAVANDIVKVNIPVVPGCVWVNLNNAVKHLREWWQRRQEKLTTTCMRENDSQARPPQH